MRCAVVGVAVMLGLAGVGFGEKKYDTGATEGEIKVGTIMPVTGWMAAYGAIGRAEAAYFEMVNDRGGVNGRKVKLVVVDNGSDFGKELELAKGLVEKEGVLCLFSVHGAEGNLAIRGYMNDKKVPQLFCASPVSGLDDPEHFPWTMGFHASAKVEGEIYAKYVLKERAGGKVAILHGDDAVGKDYAAGFREGLGEKNGGMIVKEAVYSDKEESPDKEVEALKGTGADVFMDFAVGKFATQAIRKADDLGWHPLQVIPNASLSVEAFVEPAGMGKAVGIVSAARSKGTTSAAALKEPDVQAFLAWMKKYNPQGSVRDQLNVYGYEAGEALEAVLKKCGDDLTRENVMKQAASLDMDLGMLLPGIRVKTSGTDYRPIKEMNLMRFDGERWQRLGGIGGGE